ncbi:hypothetical protein C9374_011001 [Naegleria lovaniensis]|uniref:Guanine nucleotide-binding protein subunit beta-like protein n=1 Tax=Naegleria lovaniensis TaxID=51637 RepID=A0AA88KF14_NAELO|nr:uncharacterized protein C9374_011001 [Naegleria lovaniensis]KAG2374164.1 hypothetical protein C9374_011001 [Naegleria lovaniensis]
MSFRDYWSGEGPDDDKLVSAHGRPINIMIKKDDDTIITGSQDHSAKVIKVSKAKVERELYTKAYGHKEWVTALAYSDCTGKIITGGMDSKLCVWESKGPVKCVDLLGHSGSISQVSCSPNLPVAISSSYDKSLKIWNLQNNTCMNTLINSKLGHDKAIKTFLWNNSLICSGGRDGLVCMWDVQSGDLISVGDEHKAPVQCLVSDESRDTILSGGMDGSVQIWDLRTANNIGGAENVIRGSINDMKLANENMLVVGGSDKTIRVLDPRKNYAQVISIKDHVDVITQLQVVDDLLLSCAANGWVLVSDLTNHGVCMYGVGASEATSSCNCILAMEPHYLCTAGDDGNVIIFNSM